MNRYSDDDNDYVDVDGLVRTIALNSSNIKPGCKLIITAKIKDKDGLRSIQLGNVAFNINKVIDLTLDNIIYSFNLNSFF